MNSAFVQVLTAIAMVLTIVVPMTYYFKGEHSKNRYKKSLAANVSGFFGLQCIIKLLALMNDNAFHSGQTHARLQQLHLLQQKQALVLQPVLVTSVQLLLQVFPVLVPVSPLHLPQAQLLEQSAKTAASLVNP